MNNIYVLYGINKFLVNYNLKKIIGDNEIEEYDLESITIEEVLNYARELPMFSDKKYVVCDNCVFLSTSKSKVVHNLDILIDYLNNPIATTVLILICREEKLDGRKKVNTLLEQNKVIKECNVMLDDDIFKYTKSLFNQNKTLIDDDVVRYLINRVNSNVDLLSNEVDKLSLYGDIITRDVINDLVSESVDDNIFNFIDSIIKNDKRQMFLVYSEAIKRGMEVIQLIAMLSNEFRIIYQVRSLLRMGYTEKDIMAMLDIYKIGRIKYARSKGNNLSNERLLEEIGKLADLDILIKTGEIDKNIAFEQYMLNL